MRATGTVAVCLACVACFKGTIGAPEVSGMGGDDASIGGDADVLPGGDAASSGGDAASSGGDAAGSGDSAMPGDAGPVLPTVTLRDQLLGAASVVVPWGM